MASFQWRRGVALEVGLEMEEGFAWALRKDYRNYKLAKGKRYKCQRQWS